MMTQARHMAVRSSCYLLFLVTAIVACERQPQQGAADSPGLPAPAPAETTTVPADRPVWDASLGPVLLVPGEAQHDASVVFPTFTDSTLTDTTTFDTSIIPGMRVDLFSHAGQTGTGQLRPANRRARDGCVAWPEAPVAITDTIVRSGVWTVGFAAGRAIPLAMDSLESLSGADSARLTAEVSRLASLLPADTAAAFHGIPFFVRQIRRFRAEPDKEILVANVTRRINQEANPREEQLLLVAERSDAQSDARYTTAYHERVSGHEEAIETTDVLAAITVGRNGRPAIVLIRDYGDGSAYALLTPVPAGGWHVGWSSAYTGC